MTPIAPLITQFLREHMPRDHGYSLHTCETYAHAFRLLFLFASERLRTPPSQLTLEHLDAALVLQFLTHLEHERRNGAATRNARLAAIKTFMRFVEFHVPSALAQVRQICAIPEKRHNQNVIRHLTLGEVRAILNAPGARRHPAGESLVAADAERSSDRQRTTRTVSPVVEGNCR